MSFLAAVKLAVDYVLTHIEASITQQLSQNVRVDLYRHLISVSPGSLKKYSVGDLLAYLAGDVERVEYLIYSGPSACYSIWSAPSFSFVFC